MQQTQIFKRRTHKAVKGLANIALVGGMAVALAGGGASADEVTTPATEVVAEEVPTSPSTDLLVTKTPEEDLTTEQELAQFNKQLDEAVDQAKSNGVTTTEEKPVEHETEAAAKADLKAQLVALRDASAEAKAKQDAKAKAEEENKALQADYDKKKADYDTAKKKYDADMVDYDQKVKARQDALKNPVYRTASDSFAKSDIDTFLKDTDLSKVSYISVADENKHSLDASKLHKLTYDEAVAYFKGAMDATSIDASFKQGLQADIDRTKTDASKLYLIKVGDTFTFKNVFVDADTGKSISLKYTVSDILDGEEKLDSTVIGLSAGLNFWLRGNANEVKTKVEYVDEAGNVVTVKKAILGVGDVDNGQFVKIDSKGLSTSYLAGPGVTITQGNGSLLADSAVGSFSDNPTLTSHQIWVLLEDTSSFDFTIGEKNGLMGSQSSVSTGAWYQIGAIPFSIEIPAVPVKPTEPVEPTLTLKDVPATTVSVSYHHVTVKKTPAPSPEPPKPVDEPKGEPVKVEPKAEPKVEPVKATPAPKVEQPAKALPQTGESSNASVISAGLMGLSVLLLTLTGRKAKETE